MAIINGTSGDDLLSTKKRGDILNGDEGDDMLVARHGFNILLGGEGDDQLTAVSSFNILSGGAGNDTLRADRGWNLLLAGDGDDGLYASSDYNILSGDAGNDVLTVLEGRGNILHGGVGDDFLQTFGSDSTIYGDSGNDTLVIDGGIGSVLHGGDGDDSLYSFSNGNVLNGDAGNDSLYVNASSWNILNGGDGDDFLVTEFDNNILNGDAGNDYLQVNSGSGNVLNGGDGDDSLVSQFDNNILNGDAGNDTLSVVGGSGNLLDGGDGNDALSGGSGDDTLDGGAGDDAIKGSAGADTLVGGTGTDTLSYDDSPTRVIVNMFNTGTVTVGGITVQPGTAFDGFGTTDLISGFENVVGSAFNDFLQGSTNVANHLEGGAGNDTLVGSGMSDGVMSPAPGAADDTLLGGAGDDVLRQTRGHDHLDGGSGFSDRLEFVGNGIAYGGVFGVDVNLGAGTSDADAGGVDSVNGAGGDIATITGIEQVFGTAGNDVLTGGSLARSPAGGFTEIFRGNAGDDTIDGQGADTAQGAFDLDRVEYVNSPGPVIVNLGTAPIMVGPEVVAGGTARDGFGTTDTLLHVNYVMGSAFADTLIGGNPEYDNTFERFEGRGGDDFMDGGSGIDEVSYQNAPGPVTVNLGSGTATGADGNDTFVNMEGARGSQSGDVLIGSNDVNVVEHFIGDGGNDFIDGGAGIDFASWQAVALAAGGVNAFIENGSGVVFQSQAGTDTLTNIEGLVGTNSNDTLAGGMGDQWFRGRGGSDLLNGGVGSDTADYSVDPGAVTVNLATGTATDGWGDIWALGGTDTLISIENVKGSQFNDTLTGDANANRLDGGAGDDAIKGSAGADTLVGGTAPTRCPMTIRPRG